MTNDATVRSPIVHTQSLSLSSSHICIAGQPDSAANTGVQAQPQNHNQILPLSLSLSFLRLFLPSNHKKRKENDYLSLCANVLRVKDASHTENGTVSQHVCPCPTNKTKKKRKTREFSFFCFIFPKCKFALKLLSLHTFL